MTSFSPQIDIYSTAQAYVLFLTVPNADPIVEMDYDPGTRSLSVTGTLYRPGEFSTLSPEELAKELVLAERPIGTYERKIVIPGDDEVNYRKISTKFTDGVLRIQVPKGPVTDPRGG
jgi:HSP20 family molecular chaperone IbpA